MFFQTLIHWWWLDAAFRGNSATLCSPFDRDIAWDWLVLLKHLFYSIGYSLVWKETVVYWSFFSSLSLHLFVSVVSLPSNQNRSNWIWPTNPTHGGLRRSRLQCRNNRSPLNATGKALNGCDFRGLLLSLSLTHAKRGGGEDLELGLLHIVHPRCCWLTIELIFLVVVARVRWFPYTCK
jgi:hypothetical protein